MASNSGTRKKSASANKTGSGKRKSTVSSGRPPVKRTKTEDEAKISRELLLLVLFAAVVLLFLCNFGVIGPVGDGLSGILFGLFGFIAYVAPILIFLLVAFGISNKGNPMAMWKLGASIALVLSIMCLLHLFGQD
ncbi:MAG: DNA translocase FtsK, partial [Lachnospiraceae bacterium]